MSAVQVQANDLPAEYSNLSAADLFKKAEALEKREPKLSEQLANKAVGLAKKSKNDMLAAQVYFFLAELAEDAKDYALASEYFLEASDMYSSVDDPQEKLESLLGYGEMLVKAKRYKDALALTDNLLPLVKDYNNELFIARSLIVRGDSYYRLKGYKEAITAYTEAVTYLTREDDKVKKRLGTTYKQLAQSYKRLKDKEKTADYYRKTLTIFTELGDERLMARTLNTLAEAERHLGNFMVALEYSLRGLELHQLLDDPEGRAKALIGAGIIYRNISRYEASLKHFLQANQYYTQVNDIVGMAKTSNQVGLIYTKLKQFEQARSFYEVTVDFPEGEVDLNTLASAYRELAVIDLDSEKFELARSRALKALQIYRSTNAKSNQALTLRIIGNTYRDEGDEANALSYYSSSLALAKEIGSKIYQIKAQTPIAALLIDTDVEEAIKLLKRSVELATQINEKYQILYAYRVLVDAEKARGNIAHALEYSQLENDLIMEINKEDEDNHVAIVKASLYSHKMEVELKALREKAKLDKLELERKNNEIEIVGQAKVISDLELTKNRYATVALLLLLVVCLGLVLLVYRRFTDSKKLNRELDYLAARDPLTNCYNRRILFELINRDFAGPEPMNEYCVVMVDIDHFKKVNDTYGHSTGDVVLRGVANAIQNTVRQNDIVARYGGEEFCVVLPNASQKQAMRIGETIRVNIENTKFEDVKVTSSLGVSSIKFNARSPTELIAQADDALYKSKASGRNQVTLWSESLIK
ncbi:diguanylate cyclase [Paraglaciecola sp. 2405UD69-4]|uniref:diguanylate cyclase n=1 Tax=Paraglaciecola sp. 2405UD69-4 TaxID=3391836 RepID=UPI0039C972B8